MKRRRPYDPLAEEIRRSASRPGQKKVALAERKVYVFEPYRGLDTPGKVLKFCSYYRISERKCRSGEYDELIEAYLQVPPETGNLSPFIPYREIRTRELMHAIMRYWQASYARFITEERIRDGEIDLELRDFTGEDFERILANYRREKALREEFDARTAALDEEENP